VDVLVSDSDIDIDNNEHCDGGLQLAKPISDEYEFGNTELEDLMLSEGP
jgi:hypothetical protein